jgi:hypothetical protein
MRGRAGFTALGATHSILRCLLLFAVFALPPSGCSNRGDGDPVLEEEILGFHLGERMDDLFERARGRVTWKRVQPRSGEFRGDLYEFSSGLVLSKGVERLRLAFVDGRLMEIIVYYENTGVSQLRLLKEQLEERYNTRASSPDGTIEMTYKTYWLSAPGMSVAVRRITKAPSTELYVQYLHDGILRTLREKKETRR